MRYEDTLGSWGSNAILDKGGEVRGLGFQREGRYFTGRPERRNAVVSKALLGNQETVGPREVQLSGSARFSPSATFSLFYDAEMMRPSFKQVLLSEFLSACKGEVRSSFWVISFLITSLKSILQKSYFGVAKLEPLSSFNFPWLDWLVFCDRIHKLKQGPGRIERQNI